MDHYFKRFVPISGKTPILQLRKGSRCGLPKGGRWLWRRQSGSHKVLTFCGAHHGGFKVAVVAQISLGWTVIVSERPALNRGEPEPPPLLTSTQLARAKEKWHQLTSLPSAQNLLASEVLDWVRAHPADPRKPHVLWLAAAATGKYIADCPDQTTPQLQRQALHMLKTRYPDSNWALTPLPDR